MKQAYIGALASPQAGSPTLVRVTRSTITSTVNLGWVRAGDATPSYGDNNVNGNGSDALAGRPCDQSWGSFLRNHLPQIAAMDLFVVPTIGFNLLYVLVIIWLGRRELVWIDLNPPRCCHAPGR